MAFVPNSLTQYFQGVIPATGTTLATVNVPNDGLFHIYQITILMNVSAYTSGTVNIFDQYTDRNNQSRSSSNNLPMFQNNSIVFGAGAAADFQGIPVTVMVYPGGTLVLKTAGAYSLTGTYLITVTELL